MNEMIAFPAIFSIKWLRTMYLLQKITPEAVVAEIIKRSELDQDMNIWITKPSMNIVKPYIDRLKTLKVKNNPLWGIPFAIKDNIDVKDIPTTAGCPEYAYTPVDHATVVERLIEAGAIPLGKTNLDQFATGLVGTRSPYGATKNAINPELISGGSSSGSAVAVARGQAAFALGTDTAGSGRVPAALNQLVGFKPSIGAWSVKGVVPACQSLDCVTVFASNVEDVLQVDQIVRGDDLKNPWSRKVPRFKSDIPQKVLLPNKALQFFGLYSNQYERAWKTAIEKISSLDVEIEYVDPALFFDVAKLLYDGPWVAERWASLGEFIESNPDKALPVTEKILRSGTNSTYTAASLFQAMYKIKAVQKEVELLLKKSVLVLPTCGGTWKIEQVAVDPIGTNSKLGLYTNHCNLLDLCALALPMEEADENLPFGITAFSLFDQENLLFGFAEMLDDNGVAFECGEVQSSDSEGQELIRVAVCGLHMRGFPLEKQMKEFGARFLREDKTAACYQLIKLPTVPEKPGLIKKSEGGSSIHLEIWEIPLASFGAFTNLIPSPLSIGKVELLNGEEVSGFICEAYAAKEAEDITSYRGWRMAIG